MMITRIVLYANGGELRRQYGSSPLVVEPAGFRNNSKLSASTFTTRCQEAATLSRHNCREMTLA